MKQVKFPLIEQFGSIMVKTAPLSKPEQKRVMQRGLHIARLERDAALKAETK